MLLVNGDNKSILDTSGGLLNSVISFPREAMAKTKNPSGLSTAVKPYRAASAAASEQTIALPNCCQKYVTRDEWMLPNIKFE